MSKFLHITEVKKEFEARSLSNVAEYPIGITLRPANGKITVFKEDKTYDQRAKDNIKQLCYKVPSRITMASYLDNINWRMTGTDNNKFDIPQCTFREILQHSMYLSKGYNAAKFKGNMTKRIWYHKELKLMMIQYILEC